MGINVAQSATAALTGQGSSAQITPTYSVNSGSTLVLIGAALRNDTSETCRVTAVSDTASNTWQTPTNVIGAGNYQPNVFVAYAYNVASGTPTVTATLSMSEQVLLTWALIEVRDVATASAVDKNVTGTASSGTSTSTSATGTLTQADNLVVLCAGGWFGVPQNPSGFTSVVTQQNGAYLGCQISHKVVAATTTLTGVVAHEATDNSAAVMIVLKQIAGGSYRYKFLLDSATFTSADTSLTAYVWRNAGPDGVLAEKYTGLSGSGTAGTLYITSGLPGGVTGTDTITGQISNATDTSGIISGAVEAV